MTKILRPHQSDALSSVVEAVTNGNGEAKGRIVAPTGAGKTLIEASVIQWQMTNNETHKIHVVLAPRIMLVNQLAREFREFLGDSYVAIAFHSGHHEEDFTKINWSETATTKVDVVQENLARAQKMGKHLVVFSTYHSCAKLSDFQFDTLLADESQYCTAEEFSKGVTDINSKVKLYFTATERHTAGENGRGLNNVNMFGERLYQIMPATLIELGYIVPPRLHIMHSDIPVPKNKKKKDMTLEEGELHQRAVVNKVIELAKAQHELTVGDLGFSKILFSLNTTDDVKAMSDNFELIRKSLPNHDIFTVTSRDGERINGVQCSDRDAFLKEVKVEGRNCLLFHYDILSEGIDVDGITGVCIMRDMGLAKILQTIGRAVRVYKPDPSKKKQAWISVPVFNGDDDSYAIINQYVRGIRNAGYDVTIEEIVETHWPKWRNSDGKVVDDAYGADQENNKHSADLVNIMHEIEKETFFLDLGKLPEEEQIDKLFEIFNANFEVHE